MDDKRQEDGDRRDRPGDRRQGPRRESQESKPELGEEASNEATETESVSDAAGGGLRGKRNLILGGGVLLFLLLIFVYFRRQKGSDAYFDKQGTESRESLFGGSSKSRAKLFLVEKVLFTDAIDGLIGTVKGDTLELTFGGQQEEKMIAVHVDVGQVVKRGKLLFELDHVRSRARKKQAEIALNRMNELLTVGGATLQDVQEAQASYDIAKKDHCIGSI